MIAGCGLDCGVCSWVSAVVGCVSCSVVSVCVSCSACVS